MALNIQLSATTVHNGSSHTLWLLLVLLLIPAILLGIPAFARINVGPERRRLVRWATPFLEPDEQIHAVFKVGLPVLRHLDAHMIAATNRAILVLHVDWGRATPPRRLPMRQARNVYFGRPRRQGSYILQPSVILGNQTLVVPKRFFKDVTAADSALDEMNRAE